MRLIDVNAFLARDEQREEPIAEDREGCASHERDILKELNDGETEYAILSHRWGDEVNYIEMSELMGFRVEDRDKIQRRDGYHKILNGCKQAERDGIEWLWVDTCCIDKRSSSELSEAINSMYRWYEDAKICYAYLHGVDVESFPTEPNGKTFPKSDGWPEWFSRGWTLQELIAPRQLQFFNRDWESIGMKGELARNLNRITRIPEAILVNGLTSFRPCTAQIMSWAANQKTTRVEDRAYSLLGLLDVNMPMLYGEGKNAFHRLQLEIIHKSNDQSIFAWGHGKGGIRSVLADDPSLFRDCHNVVEMDRDEFDIHLQERLRGTAARSVPLPKKRGSFSVTNQGIQIWLPIVPYDFTDTLSRATLACCRWDRKPITIDLALWGSNYYRSPSTRNMPNVIPQFHKIYLSHQSKAYPDIKFELGGKDGIHNTLCSRGFTLLGSFPGDMTHVVWTSDRYDRFFRVLSGINALAISVYEQGRSPRTRLAVVFGCFLGHPWVRVTQDRREGSWKQYAEKVYNQMWTAGTHIARSSFPNNTHVHLDWPDWVGWTVQLTQSRCNTSIESTSSQVDITLSQCTAKQCDGQKGWDDIAGNRNTRFLTELTKRVPDLNHQVVLDPTTAKTSMGHVYYRGTLSSEGGKVIVKKRQNRYTDQKDAYLEPFIWSLLDSKNIHQFLGVITTFDDTVSIVAKWADEDLIHCVRYSECNLTNLLLEVTKALNHLHNHPQGQITHGDVQGSNVLVVEGLDDDKHALLTNFSCSAMRSVDMILIPCNVGDVKWMAPEHINGIEGVTAKGDVWAFGITMLEVFSVGMYNERGILDNSLCSRIRRGELPPRPTRMPDEWWELCTSCWNLKPSSRPSMSILVKKIEKMPRHYSSPEQDCCLF